jgi:hypothetical protein
MNYSCQGKQDSDFAIRLRAQDSFLSIQTKRKERKLETKKRTMVELDSYSSSAGLLGFSLVGNRRRYPDAESVVSNTSTKKSFMVKSALGGSDTSSSSDEDEFFNGPNEFVVECKGGEMVFVTAVQGRAVKTSCHFFRDRLIADSVQGDGRIVRMSEWSVATVRRLIEILTTGSTWIENDASCFSELLNTAKEAGIDLRLGSLINYHDILDKEGTQKFFNMFNLEKYQFKLRATVKSSQWMHLMKKGVLLLLKSKVLMVKIASKNANRSQKRGSPSNERLAKCDSICSEFCVYANGNVNALLAIMDVLSPAHTPKEKVVRNTQEEEFKLVFKTSAGYLPQEDLDMLWRITTSSYTMSTVEEQGYLYSKPEKSDASSSSNGASESAAPTNSTALALVGQALPSKQKEYQCRSMTGTSFLVLKHLFDSVNTDDGDLSASLVVKAPTPDTLGRLINATRQCQEHDLGFNLEQNVYFAATTSREMKHVLAYLADYSSSAIVAGDFKMSEKEKQA